MTYKTIAAAVSVLAGLAVSAAADELSYASGWAPGASTTPLFEAYAKRIGEETNGELTMQVYPLSLLNFIEANDGVKNGIADLITLLPPYFATEYPHVNLIGETTTIMALEGNESTFPSVAFAGMMTELALLNCPSCQSELANQNQIMLGVPITTTYVLACVPEVKTINDLSGKRVRTAGAYWARWAEKMGAVPVSMSINETFEALEQGVLDCTLGNTTDLKNFGLLDVLKNIYVGAPSGMFPFPTTMNISRWQGLPEGQRAAMLRATAQVVADLTWDGHILGLQAIDDAKGLGINVADISPDVAEKHQVFMKADLASRAADYKEKFGLTGGEEIVQQMEASAQRWINLTAHVASADDLEKVLWEEIYSKLDVASYGMN